MLEEIREHQIRMIAAKRRAQRIRNIILLLLAALPVGGILIWGMMNAGGELETTVYRLVSEKIEGEYRIAVLSDLHNAEFGKDNQELIGEIAKAEPDMILMCGDMVVKDDPDIDTVLGLCGKLLEVADIYFILGNHEGILEYAPDGPQIPLCRYLEEMGVKVCYPGVYRIPCDKGEIELFSVSMEEESYRSSDMLQQEFAEFTERDSFKIVASHVPTMLYETLYDESFDLGVAGHFHGGQVILPGIGGLYHKDAGLFPRYYGGLYSLGKGQMVLSRGLGNSSWFPRINNNPELVIVEINHE